MPISYTTRNDCASKKCYTPRDSVFGAMEYTLMMDNPGHYIREWRKHRGLSLRKLADRMETAPGENLISYASLSRIEKGEQPYSQPILEALAAALSVPISHLLSQTPGSDADIVELFSALSDSEKAQAIKILKAMAG